jgi:hypothetical protein
MPRPFRMRLIGAIVRGMLRTRTDDPGSFQQAFADVLPRLHGAQCEPDELTAEHDARSAERAGARHLDPLPRQRC